MKQYGTIARIGLLTAAAILLFQSISLLAVYRYVRMDLYLGLVAVCFLAAGLIISQRRTYALPAGKEDDASTQATPTLHDLLTHRELEVLQLIAAGKTNKEIAALQYIEISTVKTHVNNIYGKLSVNNRKEARSRYVEMTEKG